MATTILNPFPSPVAPWDDQMGPVTVRGNDNAIVTAVNTLAAMLPPSFALGTANQMLRTNSAATAAEWHTLVAADITNPAALTKTDDTNVTLTLGGAPSTALLTASSITAGWTGQLAVGRGGTGLATFTAAGGMAYATAATTLAVLAIGAANTVLLSTGSAPSWVAQSTLTAPAGLLTGTTLAANVVASSLTSVGTLTALTLSGAISGATTINSTSRMTITGNASISAPGSDGIGQFGSSTADGFMLIGRGSSNDIVCLNKNGFSIWIAATGTRNTDFAGNITVAGTAQITSLGAFAAGDKYLIVDASGNVHKSALGPAS